ncbi:MAG TPA: nicotinate phosphoribosyltransferase [Phycisphaerae bacterium]|jgi:nicotinate phosphoribosyltransferase
MGALAKLYRWPLTLLNDLYQFTMAYGYWTSGTAEHEAVFHLSFRSNPFGGGFSLACGLAYAIEWLNEFHFAEDDLAYLADLRAADGSRLFDAEFIEHLRGLSLACDVDALPEGTVVFANEPLVRVRGPLLQCQLLETPLLNLINFQSLIATKAARVCLAAQGEPVLEFGLRRAQGIDGGVAASRAAYVGGCAGTSNVLAGRLFGIPVKGTHAHSWIMSFDSELKSFRAYAEALPENCTFLVDTYDTLEGVRRAIEIGRWLRSRGHEMAGIRLDSGDLARLSSEARRILDEAGFERAAIVGSNELDEHAIAELKMQGAKVNVWGVGTRLATGWDQPAMSGVYKLSAIRAPGAEWKYKIKLSEQAEKGSTPGIQQVRRFRSGERFVADAIYDEELGIVDECVIVGEDRKQTRLSAGTPHENLLLPIFRGGQQVYDPPALDAIRAHAQRQLAALDPAVRRLEDPRPYPVGLEQRLHELKRRLIGEARGALT